ncbi:unnamed protein product [Rhizoctonia solani]|uniref:Xylanolytic transcriptional activator regulatory domain-containing protein n=1 Tax=Rhizoctonia solani TaxID=456999 RepID=A0A8H3H8G2_9AGAM|nr:unnamed protein product [Rhizoctonia solani]
MSLVLAMNADGGGASATAVSPRVGRECSWSIENDARRPATKQLVESLHAKIQSLEAELAQLKGRPVTSSADSDAEPSTPVVNASTFPSEPAEPSSFERERPEAPNAQLTMTVMYRYIFDIDSSIPANEQSKDVHLSVACQWNRYLPQLPHLTRLEHDTILLRCFQYGVAWLHCMLPEAFLHDMLYALTSESSAVSNPLRLQHYTPMLHCALLAYACAFSDNPEIRSLSFRAKFAQYAKQWLDYEFERPVMALVRALALLGEYHCGIGQRSSGFMYMGMSIRAARSLILVGDHESWINEGSTAHSEVVERDWHFWSAFCQDKIMALEFNQEHDVPVPHLGVSLPSIDGDSDNQPWSNGLVGFPPRLTTKTFFDSCKLMVISTRIIEFLHTKDQEGQDERAVINLHLQLDTWFNNLPRELLVWARSTSPLPHIITLHICYWFLLVCLHQPLYHRPTTSEDDKGKGPNTMGDVPNQGGGNDPIHDLSIKMVDRATHKIVQLLQMFEEQHGMRFFPRNMIYMIYECGLVLMKEAATVPFAATKKRATAIEAGHACLRALKGTSVTWPWAEQLATRLEGCLNAAGANTTLQPFTSNWSIPVGGTNSAGADMSPTFHQFVHVWDSTGMEAPGRINLTNRIQDTQPTEPNSDMTTTRGMVPSSMGLGLQGLVPQNHDLGHPTIRRNLGEEGSAQVDGETRAYDMVSFSDTPTSSTSSYSAPHPTQQGSDEDMWSSSLFD